MTNHTAYAVRKSTGVTHDGEPGWNNDAGFKSNGRDSYREEFETLAMEWNQDTAAMSALNEIMSHPAYLRIVGLGPNALPFILEDLRKSPKHWFPALRAISGTSPVRPQDVGNIANMTKVWLAWGKLMGYIGNGDPRSYFATNVSSTDQFRSGQSADYRI